MKRLIGILSLVLMVGSTMGQDSTDNEAKSGKRNFLFSGSANTLTMIDADSWDNAAFGLAWMPVLLWQPSEKLFFESHLHIEIEPESGVVESDGHAHSHGTSHSTATTEEETPGGTGAMVMLGYANLVYLLNDYITITAGQFLSPFGTFQERFHPAWVNKLPDTPLGLGHHNNIAPGSEVGVQVRGTIPFGSMKLNYATYVSNGPVLFTTEENGGTLGFDNFKDNNKNKAIGGRIGWLPLSNSSLELGGSFHSSKVGTYGSEYENVTALLLGADLAYYKSYSGFGDINIKGQWINSEVGDAIYPRDSMMMISNLDTMYMTEYSFDNKTQMFYVQVSYRPSKMENEILQKLEFVGRFDNLTMPEDAIWEASNARLTLGLDYWIEARSVLKLAYQSGLQQKSVMAQLVIGF